MALEITNNTQRALGDVSIQPNIVIKFEGIDYYFSSAVVKDYVRIGDPDLLIDGSWTIGGFRPIQNNKTYIDSKSTTYTIRQQINYDEGDGNSVQTMTVGLIDKDEFITQLISPGFLVEDILARKAQVFVGFGVTSFSDDYVEVFKGFVTKVQSLPGSITFTINHPDNKKKINLFKSFSGELSANIQTTALTATLNTTTGLKTRIPGVLETYLKIDDEVMKYTVTSSTGVSLVRGQLNTVAAIHEPGAAVSSFYTLSGNPLDLALYFMMSGFGTDPVYSNINVQSFVKYGVGTDTNSNAIFFQNINLSRDYGIRAGDTCTITGATHGANNFTNRTVLEVGKKDNGYYIVVDGAALTLETDSPAVMSFKTQFNVFDDGMKMHPDEVDIDQHIFIRDFFHPSTQMEFYIDSDLGDGKTFLDEQIYKPIACYSLPRKAKSSVGYAIGPIPGSEIKSLSVQNTVAPTQAYIERTTSRAFFNEVVYKYDPYVLATDKFLRGFLLVSEESKSRITGGSRTYKVESKGLRSSLNGQNIVESQAQRIIDRYKFAAEGFFVQALFQDGVPIEIGDVVILEASGLKVSDIKSGNRAFAPRLFEVRNKVTNLKTGEINFELLDTAQNINTRYGLMAPVSKISGVVSQSQFVITYMDNYPSKYGLDEYRNWTGIFDIQDKIKARIRTASYIGYESVVISNINGNTFTLETPAVMTLTPGLVIELETYDNATDKSKLIYAFYQDDPTFTDGKEQYSMI
jgi:hypothetical protein